MDKIDKGIIETFTQVKKSKCFKISQIIVMEKNKDSFAKVLSITTISKHRIKKSINVLDPIGKIQLSKETMDRIDTEIVKAITNNAL